MLRTAQPQELPQKSSLRTAGAQRRYRYRNALAGSPDAYPPLSREKTFHRKRQAQVRARRGALMCPPSDLTKPCDATMNWTFTVSDKQNTMPAFASTTATTHLAYSPLPTTPCRLTFPENAPLLILAFLQATAPPLYLPMHQQDIIYTILYCVCNIGDNVHECTLCLEGYHGMSLHNTLCARCHNEVRNVRSSFSSYASMKFSLSVRIPPVVIINRTGLTIWTVPAKGW